MASSKIQLKYSDKIVFVNTGASTQSVTIPIDNAGGYYIIGYTTGSNGMNGDKRIGFLRPAWNNNEYVMDEGLSDLITVDNLSLISITITIRAYTRIAFIPMFP